MQILHKFCGSRSAILLSYDMELWTVLASPLVLAVAAGITLVIAYLYYSYVYAPFQFLKRYGIKGPQPLLFYGNYKEISKLGALKFYESLYKNYGPVCGFYVGQRPYMMVADLEMVKHVTVKEFNSFMDREHFPDILKQKENAPRGLLQAEGETWRRVRQSLSPTFSTGKIKMMVPLVKNSCDTLVEKLGEYAESGKSVDVFSKYGSFTMETILATAFGRVIDIQRGEGDQLTDACAAVFSSFQEGTSLSLESMILVLSNFPCLRHVFRLLISLSMKGNPLGVISKTALSLAQARREEDNSSKHKDFLQLMIDATMEGEDGETRGLTDEDIVASSTTFLLAGYETTANTLAYASYLLALNPEIQDRLQAKIDEYFESNPEASIYDATQEVHYVDMVIQESLRMYPPAPRTTRHAQKTIEINGVTIPEGVSVLIPIHLFHYNPEYWTEPEKFDPERFTPEEKTKRPAICHMPFGWGPRNCIGMRFALMEAKMALIEIMKKYTFVRAPETEVPLKTVLGPTLAPKNGVYLQIAVRD